MRRRSGPVPHGTSNGYGNYRCRCEPCKAAAAVYAREMRRKHYKPRRRPTLPERFWARVDKNGPLPECDPSLGPCWIWTGARSNRGGGYGQLWIGDGKKPALLQTHRFCYELFRGPIPDGLDLDHLCRVTMCVRPSHLEPVTHAENMRRGGVSRRMAVQR